MSNCIKNVAITGAGGNSGSRMVESLLATGNFSITAITRADSKSQLPAGCKVAEVDYSNEDSLVAALKGQDALVITLAPRGTDGVQEKLINAAAKAGVAWIMPNEWSPDVTSEGVRTDVSSFAKCKEIRDSIKELGKSSYIAQTNGFWYEWSLAIPLAFGFDIEKKEATFFDNGETKICTSTWPQCGRAVAAVLSLPIKGDGLCLDKLRDQNYFINSFTVSQKDMLESILRVTGDKIENWKITNVPARERVAVAQEELKKGNFMSYVKVMYTRIFYDDNVGDFSSKLINNELGLPKEDLDEATKVAIERAKTHKW